jgi:hypothetical protein
MPGLLQRLEVQAPYWRPPRRLIAIKIMCLLALALLVMLLATCTTAVVNGQQAAACTSRQAQFVEASVDAAAAQGK